MEHDISAIDKRLQMRFNVADSDVPLVLEQNDNITSVIDISRGGMSVTHDDTLNVGDVVPVHITYGDVEIDADVKIVSASKTKAGAQFVNLDDATANKLLYMNLLLEQKQDQQNDTYKFGPHKLSSDQTKFD